tara:strand:- start:12325 stop:12663 length:339 start_codon:yes stop_codon:yes gene_type:complete
MKKLLLLLSLVISTPVFAELLSTSNTESAWESASASGKATILVSAGTSGDWAGSTVTIQLQDEEGEAVATSKTCTADPCSFTLTSGEIPFRAAITDLVGSPDLKVTVTKKFR